MASWKHNSNVAYGGLDNTLGSFDDSECSASLPCDVPAGSETCNPHEWVRDERVGRTICRNCGYEQPYSDMVSTPWERTHTFKNQYKRVHHVHERYCQISMEESEVPDEILEEISSIAREDKRFKYKTKLGTLSKRDISQILRLVNPSYPRKYLEKWISILWHLTGRKPKRLLGMEEREKLDQMFREVERMYDDYKGYLGRYRNIMNLNFLLRALLLRIGRADLCRWLPLMKDRKKLSKHELLWGFICDKLNWEFRSPVEYNNSRIYDYIKE